MKKLVVLSFLIIVSSVQADVVSKIDPYLNKYGAQAGDKITKGLDKIMEKEVYKPLKDKNKELKKIRDEQKELFEENAKNVAERAALALWAKIKGLFGKKRG